ncbi:MAG: tyrosine-type recombinase/integrase [Bacillota bacterium]|nr:tyrosine-type recombinase/integrase [Bacillota bacterium]
MSQYKNTNGDGWYIKVTNPRTKKSTTIRTNPKTGQRFSTKKEAKEYEMYYLKHKVNLSMTMDELFIKYIDTQLSPRENYSATKSKSWYNTHIKKKLGKRKITSLKLSDLESLARDMLDNGYSIHYINKMTTNIKTVLNYGVSHGFIETNPVSGYRSMKEIKTSDEIKYWTPREFQKVIDSISECYNENKTDIKYIRFFLIFGYLTGARKGEIRALKWNQIELNEDSGVIHFDYHLGPSNNIIKGRKNGNGYILHLDSSTLLLTKQIKEHFSRYDNFDPNGFVFPSLTSGFSFPLGAETPRRWIKELAEYNNLKNITFHGLRHSLVCYLATEVKLFPYEVADRIGDTVEVVLKHYYQFFQESRIKVANTISNHENKYFKEMIKEETFDDNKE